MSCSVANYTIFLLQGESLHACVDALQRVEGKLSMQEAHLNELDGHLHALIHIQEEQGQLLQRVMTAQTDMNIKL